MEENKNTSGPKIIIASIIFISILLVSIVLTVYFVRDRLIFSPSAKYQGDSQVSLDNSYVFASPIRAKAGGDLVRITIFILDEGGRAVSDKEVVLGNNEGGLEIKQTQSLTDETGKAFFDVSSNIPGTYYIQSTVEGLVIPQKVKIVFD